MKLVSLYIENFGGLSHYTLEFQDGLTVIHEPNGFGKTTLAEFIRAMFYGFPRKAKTLDKSRRQKYTPWNGGKCGGNLVFELDGRRYRIERTFGATPRSDSFTLIDLTTNKKSTRFSEEIGQEIFKLDSESFERSTYMPQLHDGSSLTTNTIQAKLTDLVEDTNDINNFDKAVEVLKGKRSTFIPYRGSGGAVAEAQSQLSILQNELEQAQRQTEALEQCNHQIAGLQRQTEADEAAIDDLRRRIRHASRAAEKAAVHRAYRRLEEQHQQMQAELTALKERYPKGVPDPEKLEAARQAVAQAAVLAARPVTTQEDLDAQAFLEENSARFAGGVPSAQQLESCRKLCREDLALRAEAEGTGLSESEKNLYKNLKPIYESGALSGDRLDALSGKNRELVKLQHEMEHLVLPEQDQQKFAELERYFAPGVPEEEALDEHRRMLAETNRLRQENAYLASTPAAPPRKKVSALPAVILLVLAAALITPGIIWLVQQAYLPGGISLGAGILALVGAVFCCLHLMVSRELAGAAAVHPQQGKIDANAKEIAQLEQRLTYFAVRYTAVQPLTDALQEIRNNREDYLELQAHHNELEEKRLRKQDQIAALENKLRRELGDGDFEQEILRRRMAAGQFEDLTQELQEISKKKEALLAKSGEIQTQISAFLGTYYTDVLPEQFDRLLTRLHSDIEQYERAVSRVDVWQQRRQEHERQMQQHSGVIAEFFTEFCLEPEADIRSQLLRIRDDRKDAEELTQRLAQLQQEKEQFRQRHEEELSAPPEQTEDMDALQRGEDELTDRAAVQNARLLELRQQKQNLQQQIDRIPDIQDALEHWSTKKTEGQANTRLLDDTLAFLERAKENLTNSYLGPIRRNFGGYMQQLLGEDGEKILITPELEVQLERQGQSRELAYFSAGQTDTVMLCMRLALVDALFTDVKPFVILDDPFVNLDDAHTAEALALLQELAKDRQILYLVCNSSRSL